jgi:hypothetical protein
LQGGDSAFVLEGFYAKMYWQEGNLSIKPEFLDPANNDFSLNWNSPCIEGGKEDTTGFNLPSTDLNDNPRIINDRIDIGAYEYLFPVNVPTPENHASNIVIHQNSGNSTITVTFTEELYYKKLTVKLLATHGITMQTTSKNPGVSKLRLATTGISAGLYLVVISDSDEAFLSGRSLYLIK